MGNTKYNSLKHQYRLSSYKYSLPVEKIDSFDERVKKNLKS